MRNDLGCIGFRFVLPGLSLHNFAGLELCLPLANQTCTLRAVDIRSYLSAIERNEFVATVDNSSRTQPLEAVLIASASVQHDDVDGLLRHVLRPSVERGGGEKAPRHALAKLPFLLRRVQAVRFAPRR